MVMQGTRVATGRRPTPAVDKIAAKGEQWVLDQIEQGYSLQKIGKMLGISTMSVYNWVHERDAILSARAHKASELAAEAFEQRAIEILDEADRAIRAEPELAAPIVTLARERAQAAWRQASVRDPRRYSDRRVSTDINLRVTHATESLPTSELERIVSQAKATLELLPDGTVGGTSDSGEPG